MTRNKIELQVLNISNSQAQAGAYALVMGETNGSHSQGLGIAQAYFHYDIGKGFGF